MKTLLRILAGAFAVFMVFAMLQEWETFASAWFGGEPQASSAPEPLEESEKKAAADAVYLMLSLMQHFYTSDGDPRFADRMPASAAVLEEMRADVDYLKRNQRRQNPSLERLEVAAVEPLGPERLEIRTREWWKVDSLWLESGAAAEPARSQRIHGKYLVTRRDGSWQVDAWDFAEPDAEGGRAAGGGAPP